MRKDSGLSRFAAVRTVRCSSYAWLSDPFTKLPVDSGNAGCHKELCIAGSSRASNSVGGRFHGEKARDEISSWLTWTALDVGGPCVEVFGLNIGDGAPALVARPRTPRGCYRRQIKPVAFA